MQVIQIALSVLIFLCVVAEVVAHGFYTKSITGFGWVVAALFLFLSWKMVKLSINEYKEERKK